MDALDRTIQSRAMLWAGLVLSAAIVAGIVWTHSREATATATVDSVSVDTSGGPCSRARWALACLRWTRQGWPPCGVGSDGDVATTPLNPAMYPGDPLRGAVALYGSGRKVVTIREDSCHEQDPTVEHELGHLYGLDDGGPEGYVMATPWHRTGLEIPRHVTR